MRISDWSSDVCSSDLMTGFFHPRGWLAQARLTNDAVWKRQLAVGSGANAQIIAELPIVEVVAAAGTLPGISRPFITLPSACFGRSAERRVGKDGGSSCRSRGAPCPYKKKKKQQ